MATTFAPPTPGVGGAPATPPKKKPTSLLVALAILIPTIVVLVTVIVLMSGSGDSPGATTPTVAPTQAPATTQIGTSESAVDSQQSPFQQAVTADPTGQVQVFLNKLSLAYSTGNLDWFQTHMDTAAYTAFKSALAAGEVTSLSFSDLQVEMVSFANEQATLHVYYEMHVQRMDGHVRNVEVNRDIVFRNVNGELAEVSGMQ